MYYIHVNKPRKGDTENGYDGRFPVDRIKNSVLKRPALGQPFVQGQKGHPSDERARTMARGVCLLVCALFTQRQPPTTRHGRPLLLFAPLPRAPFGILARTSPRCIVEPLERSQPIGPAHDDFIMKKRNARVDRTPFYRRARETPRNWNGLVACPECLPSLLNARRDLEGGKIVREEGGTHGFTEREKILCRAMVLKPGQIYI